MNAESRIAEITTEKLVEELTRRGAMPNCRCQKWGTYVGIWDQDGNTLRCHGCLKAITRCRC